MLPDNHDVPMRVCECGATAVLRQVRRTAGGTGVLLAARYSCPACRREFAVSAPARATALLLGGVALGGLAGVAAAFGPRPTRVGGAVLFGLGSALLLTMGGFAVTGLAKHPVAGDPSAA